MNKYKDMRPGVPGGCGAASSGRPARACVAGGKTRNPPGAQEGLDRGEPYRVERRRATLPHPLECSTIAAPGLSYRVRNGTGRLTRAMTTAKPRSRNDNQNMAAIPAIML